MKLIKVMVVGDFGVGKTSLCIRYCSKEFPNEYCPTVFDSHIIDKDVDGVPAKIGFWDNDGGEDYHRLRPLSYPQTDVFMLCFSFDLKTSLTNIVSYWLPEIKQHCPNVPIIMVGCKNDLLAKQLTDGGEPVVSLDEAKSVASQAGLELTTTSALLDTDVDISMDKVIKSGLSHLISVEKQGKRCHIV